MGLITLSFRFGGKIVNTVEVPQYVKFTCTKSDIKKDLQIRSKENTDFNAHFLKGKVNNRLIIKVILLV